MDDRTQRYAESLARLIRTETVSGPETSGISVRLKTVPENPKTIVISSNTPLIPPVWLTDTPGRYARYHHAR